MTTYRILARPEVEDDLSSLNKDIQARILKALRERLTTSPESYGKPLAGRLKGLRRIRAGDYRIAYQVSGSQVILWAIRHRKDIYPVTEKRYISSR